MDKDYMIQRVIEYIAERLHKRTAFDGVVLIGVGALALFAKPLITIAGIVAIVYGLYTLFKSE